MNKDEILKQVQAAMDFVGQAQALAPNPAGPPFAPSDLWKELGRLYGELDSLQDALNSNEYNDAGELIG